MPKKVAVAMSGGLDSSVAAYLLQKNGCEIFGLTMQLWKKDLVPKECGLWPEVKDAKQVADYLGIPHYTCDFEAQFKQGVVDHFVQEYLQGRTPNPCIVCNQQIKFGVLLDQARQLGADYLATGHYAQICWDQKQEKYALLKAKDPQKDQSYFLYRLTQEHLKHILFPLGGYYKEEVRQIARAEHLAVAEKPESQEICFIQDNDYRGFLKQVVASPIQPGVFLNQEGKILGKHQGFPFYTIGQRKGLGIAFGKPQYVLRIESEKNQVVLGENQALFFQRLWASENNYFDPGTIQPGTELFIEAKIRNSAAPAAAKLMILPERKSFVEFFEPQRAASPGQAIVYYLGDQVVGGGTMERAEP